MILYGYMYECMYVCILNMYECMLNMYVCIYECKVWYCMKIFVCMYACMYVGRYVKYEVWYCMYIFVSMCVCVCMYACESKYVFVYMHVDNYVYISHVCMHSVCEAFKV